MRVTRSARARRLALAASLLGAVPGPAAAQHIFEVSGGGSSLQDAYGASANFWGRNHDGWLGVGHADGLRVGAFARIFVARDTVRLGNDVLSVRIPTDLFTSSPSILFQGVGYALARGHTRIRVSAGASAVGLTSPYFAAARGSYPMGMVEVADSIDRVAFSTTAVVAKRQTLLTGLRYAFTDSADAVIAGGVGANRPYVSLGGQVVQPWVRVRAAWAYRAPGFRRAEVSMPLQVETERENVEVVFTPSESFNFGIERKHYVQDSIGTAVPLRSVGTAAFAMGRMGGVRLNAGVYFAEGVAGRAVNTYGSVGRRFAQWLDVDAFYLRMDPDTLPRTYSIIGHFREQLTTRLQLMQQVSYDGRAPRVSFGGNLRTGIAELNADYQVFYLPFQAGSPFRTVLTLGARIQLGSYATNFGTTILPDGTVGYSASGSTFLYHGNGAMGGAAPIRIRFDRFMVRGQVVDADGKPVEGAAIQLGEEFVFTDSRGEFFLRTGTLRELPLTVVLEEFLLPGYWAVDSAPARVQPRREDDAQPIRIVLRRADAPAVPSDTAPPPPNG